jgi:RNA polymerase-associated protein RTF1
MYGGELRPSTPLDPSARLKTAPKVFAAAMPSGSRPGTPRGLTPRLGPTAESAETATMREVSPLPLSECVVVKYIEVDLGDF